MKYSPLYARGLALLRAGTRNDVAEFHEGQWEAIEGAIKRHEALLLVRKTGWGKSAVYFIATKLLREQDRGPTVVISPLLALMRDQIASAERYGLRAKTINSENEDEWGAVYAGIDEERFDIVFLSPERLRNRQFIDRAFPRLLGRTGMLVVDEAHCISEWGHDFRPNYRRIAFFAANLPPGIPVLATTATANETVVADVREQLGERVSVQRGPLSRESLLLAARGEMSYAERLAWLAEHVAAANGSGIIYTLRKIDADMVASWLRRRGIEARAYYNGVPDRPELEAALQENRIKALVATTALGMGFDKPDLAFVYHFQMMPSVTQYYQQVGRAGRDGAVAAGVLLSGREDASIAEYFRLAAVPSREDVEAVIAALGAEPDPPVTARRLTRTVNLREGRIERIFEYLAMTEPAAVLRVTAKSYAPSLVPFTYPEDRVEALRERRRDDFDRMLAYLDGHECLMRFLARELGDDDAQVCGHCSVCMPEHEVSDPSGELITAAEAFLDDQATIIEPVKQWPASLPAYGIVALARIRAAEQSEHGRAASVYQIGKLGRAAYREKYITGHFSDATAAALARLVERWRPAPDLAWVAPVPSTRQPDLVPELARELAQRLGLAYVEPIEKTRVTPELRTLENPALRANNLDGAFAIRPWPDMNRPGLLVDDILHTGVTIAIVSALLRRAGSGPVHPLVIASVSLGD